MIPAARRHVITQMVPRRLETAELTGVDLDAEVVAQRAQLGETDRFIAGESPGVSAGYALVVAAYLQQCLCYTFSIIFHGEMQFYHNIQGLYVEYKL